MAVKKKKKVTKKTIRKKTYKKKKIFEKIEIQPSNTEQVNNFVKKNKIQLIIAAVVVIFFGYQFYKSDTFKK